MRRLKMESNRNIGEQTVLSQTKVDKITSKINPKVFAKVAEFSSKIPPTMKSIGVLCSMFSGGTPSAGRVEYYNNGTIPFIRSGEINSETTELFLTEKGLANSAAKLVEKGDLLLALYGATSGEVGISKISGAINQAVLCIRSSQLNTLYLKNLLIFEKARILNTYLQGGQGNLSAEIIKSLKFPFPPLAEQKRIAEVLSIWDEGIERLERVIALKEKRKRALMQRLLSGKTRFSGFSAPWKEMKLGEIVTERKEKSTGKESVFSVSVHKGLVDQVVHLGRSFSAKDTSNYNLVCPFDIVYTKSPTGDFPYGIIKQSLHRAPVIVSPLYGVFIPQSHALGIFLDDYFSSPVNAKNFLLPIIQKGAKNTINITNETFLKGKIRVPTDETEISFIARFVSQAREDLSLLRRKCELLKSQKKWLMQQLLTGKKRLVK